MAEKSFDVLVDASLQSILEAIERADSDGVLEIDLVEGILTIELADGQQYVINKHGPSEQIWLSSPVSGALHFSYDLDAHDWVDSDAHLLTKTLEDELSELAGISLEITLSV